MGKIKTRESVKDIKVLDKAAVAGERMKDAYIRTRNQVQNLSDDGQASSTEYAADNLQSSMEDMASDAGHAVASGTEKAISKSKEAYQRRKMQKAKTTHTDEPVASGLDVSKKDVVQRSGVHTSAESVPYQQGKRNAREQQLRTYREIRTRTIKTAPKTGKTIKQSVRSSGKATVKTAKGSVKTAQKSIKTAEHTAKTTIKTTQQTAKAAQKTAKATIRASQRAVQAARAAAKAAAVGIKAAAKATAAAVKAIIAGTKALIAAIAAGGWVAVVVIVVICLIGLIVGSCFGIFFSGEDTGSGQTMQAVVREINTDYQTQIDTIKGNTTYDVLEMSGSRAVWKEVLAVYSVKTTGNPDAAQEVATIDDSKIAILKNIFWEMNSISYRTESKTEEIIIETDDGNGNIVEEKTTVTQTYLYITVSHKTAEGMAEEYGFTEDQKAQLAALLADENNSLWTAVLYGIGTGDGEIVTVALSQLGNIGGEPYWSWYGFGGRVEWCACFVSWCANECGYIDAGVIPKFAGCVWGVQWFRDRGLWQDNSYDPRPGDIIFFDWDAPNGPSGPQDGESDHVGIVERVENGRVYTVEGNSGDSCRSNSYPLGDCHILGYGTPAY